MPRAAARGAGAAAALFWAALPAAGEPGRAEPSGALLPFAAPQRPSAAASSRGRKWVSSAEAPGKPPQGPACCWVSEGSRIRGISCRAG